VLIEVDGKNFVIDTGPDFRQQMLRESVNQLDAVILTHSHKDHIAGLDDVRAFNYLQNADMPVYGNTHTLKQLKIEFYYAFTEKKYPGIPQLVVHEIAEHNFLINGIEFTPLPVLHMHLPVLGFRVGNFSYITDANNMPDSTLEKLKGTSILVLNALQREPHLSHFTLQEAIALAQQINANQTYFTHISHKLGLHKVVEKELPKGIALAYDGLAIHL
jgi:phosphoribosyl 1,2-cyclic phosphate phosphodiesterase